MFFAKWRGKAVKIGKFADCTELLMCPIMKACKDPGKGRGTRKGERHPESVNISYEAISVLLKK